MRVKIVFDILENSLKMYQKRNSLFAALYEQYPEYSIIHPFDNKTFKTIQQKQNQFQSVTAIFTYNSFENEFNIKNLIKIGTQLAKPKQTNIPISFYADYILNQYISFIIQFEHIHTIENIEYLFIALSRVSDVDFQTIINETIRDILLLISYNLTEALFQKMFDPISDYFLIYFNNMSPNLLDDQKQIYSLLPIFLKYLVCSKDADLTSCFEKFASLLSLLIIEKPFLFAHDVMLDIYCVIKPHLDKMDNFALIIMKELINYIDQELVINFCENLPDKFAQFVEENENPIIPSPLYLYQQKQPNNLNSSTTTESINNQIFSDNILEEKCKVTTNPSNSPECYFRFVKVPTFIHGLDLTHNPCDYLPSSPSLQQLCSPKYFPIIDLVVKILNSPTKRQEAQIFTTSFSDYIDNKKKGSKYEYDYFAILLIYWIKLDIRQIKLPSNLLSVSTSLKIRQLDFRDSIYYLIDYLTIMKVLQNGECCFDSILLEYVKYPHLLTEILEICLMQLDNLSAMISQFTKIIRTFRLIGLQLQTSEFTLSETNKPFYDLSIQVIEESRLSLFRLFLGLFEYNSFLKVFLSDNLFLSFFLSFLFEINIRKFVLDELRIYLQTDLSKDQFTIFIFHLTQVINQVFPTLPDSDGFKLIYDILVMLNSIPNLIFTYSDRMANLVLTVIDLFDLLETTEISKLVFDQIIKLITLMPGIKLDAIEKPLRQFGSLNQSEYQSILNLLACDLLKDNKLNFVIQNGHLMNILFRVFLNDTNMGITKLSAKLCQNENENCFVLHQCQYDLELLNYVLEHRNDDNSSQSIKQIPSILENVAIIASVVSSPVIVQRYISLFIPIDNRYISSIHHLLLKPLQLILEGAEKYPSNAISLSNPIQLPMESFKQFVKDSFTFTCWIYSYGTLSNDNELINIFSLLTTDDKPLFTIGLYKNLIVIQDNVTNIQITKRMWEFISLVYTDNKLRFFVEDQNLWIKHVDLKIPASNITAIIGGIYLTTASIDSINQTQTIHYDTSSLIKHKYDFIARIGNFHFFPNYFYQLPLKIFKLGPRNTQNMYHSLFNFDHAKMAQLVGYSSSMEYRTFTDILLRFFKIEILLPIFAQLDLKMMNGQQSDFRVIDIVSVFKAALFAGDKEQNDFYQAKGFQIISHLLLSSSPSQISFELYLSFYEILECLLYDNAKKDMFIEIIMNFDLWIVSSFEDHRRILNHWCKTLFPIYSSFMTELFSFSKLLSIIRIYYWYQPIEKEMIRGFETNDENQHFNRTRNPSLNISECRSLMFKLLYDLSSLQFRSEDFLAITEHCISLKDEKQQIDLLCFMNAIAMADFYPLKQLPNIMSTLLRMSILLEKNDESVFTAVLRVICSVHKYCDFNSNNELPLSNHLESLLGYIEPSRMTTCILKELTLILQSGTYELFSICTYISYLLGNNKFYEIASPSPNFTTTPNWAVWSVCEAMTETDNKKFEIFHFLANCSHTQWQNIYDTIEIVGQVLQLNEIKIDEQKTIFLKIVCLCLLNCDTNVSSEVFDHLFPLLKHHLCFRKNVNGDFISPSRALESLYKNSPFFDLSYEMSNEKSDLRQVQNIRPSDFLNIELKQYSYHFGFNIDEKQIWVDEELARNVLALVSKFRSSLQSYIGFIIILAAFVHRCNLDFVKSWTNEIQFTEKEVSDHDFEINFLYANAKGLQSYLSLDNDFDIVNHYNDKAIQAMKIDCAVLERLESSNINIPLQTLYVDLYQQIIFYIRESNQRIQTVKGNNFESEMDTDVDLTDNESDGTIEAESDTIRNKISLTDPETDFEYEEDTIDQQIITVTQSSFFISESIQTRLEMNAKIWKRLWTNVVMDGGPWDLSRITGKRSIVYWKRDNTFCKLFCPMKLKINRHPDNHLKASIARDAGSLTTATKLVEEHKQQMEEEYKKSAPPKLLEVLRPEFDSPLLEDTNSSMKKSSSHIVKSAKKSSIRKTTKNKRRTRSSISLISPEKSSYDPQVKKRRASANSSYDCELIKIRGLKHGTFAIIKDEIHFMEYSDLNSDKNIVKIYIIPMKELTYVLSRRRFHHKTAIELFLVSGESFFFNFPYNESKEIIARLNTVISKLDYSSQIYQPSKPLVQIEDHSKFFVKQHLTEKWLSGRMSNFAYLMKLNIFTGRSFNDTSQYPFLPWVISEYNTDELNLHDLKFFRDLRKPVGALGPERLDELKQRMNGMHFIGTRPYLYSSFAICPLSIYIWLLRMEPFTTLHIMMQSNKFDHPSRLFSSISAAYKLVTTHLNDYRELPPEFYFMHEFLYNDNHYDLGVTHGNRIDDVELPTWIKIKNMETSKTGSKPIFGVDETKQTDLQLSKSMPSTLSSPGSFINDTINKKRMSEEPGAECIYMFRKALESKIATEFIPDWIDLFWGYKQRGEEAHKVDNIYNANMYETAWTPKNEKDPYRKSEIEASMCHIGQFPPQIFTTPHPHRNIIENTKPINNKTSSIDLGLNHLDKASLWVKNDQVIVSIFDSYQNKSQIVEIELSIPKNNGGENDLFLTPIKTYESELYYKIIQLEFQPLLKETIAIQQNGKLVEFKKDGSLTPEFFHVELTNVSKFANHKDFMAVVSDEATLNLFCLTRDFEFSIPFYGDAITCCALSSSFKIAVCGTVSGNLVICSLFEGKKVNAINLEEPSSQAQIKPLDVLITKSWGFIVTYAQKFEHSSSHSSYLIFVHNVNGRFIRCVDLGNEAISCWTTFNSYSDFDYILFANNQGKLYSFEAFFCNIKEPFYRCYNHIVTVGYSKEHQTAFALKQDGNLIFCPMYVD